MAIVVIFHNDADGQASAYAAWKKFGDNAQYLEADYNQLEPTVELTQEDELYILDFSYKEPVMQLLQQKVGKMVVIDHHASKKENLDGLTCTVIFDITKSAARLSWEYFHPEEEIPYPILLVEDRDLWKFQYEDSKLFHAGLQLENPGTDFQAWDRIMTSSNLLQYLLKNGGVVLHYQAKQIEKFLASKDVIKLVDSPFGNDALLAVYNTDDLISEKAHAILNSEEFAKVTATMSYRFYNDGLVKVDLRSKTGSEVNVGKFAKQMGGGGHKHAAGFMMNLIDRDDMMLSAYEFFKCVYPPDQVTNKASRSDDIKPTQSASHTSTPSHISNLKKRLEEFFKARNDAAKEDALREHFAKT